MDTSPKIISRDKTVHQILGGGTVADVMLWRRKNLTIGIVSVAVGAWLIFEKSGYTLISLVSNVLLLLLSIIFLWVKSATILNRPPPPLPDLYFSEEFINDVAAFIRHQANTFFSTAKEIAMGKDTKMSLKVATWLLLISIIGSLTDFLTLCYTSLIIMFTIPVLYERYKYHIDRYISAGSTKLQELYLRFDLEILSRTQNWILENEKLS